MDNVPTTDAPVPADVAARESKRNQLTDLLEQAVPLATSLELPGIASHLEVLTDAVLAAIPPVMPRTAVLTVGAKVRLAHHPDCHEVGTVQRFGTSSGVDCAVVYWREGRHPYTQSITAHTFIPISDLVVVP